MYSHLFDHYKIPNFMKQFFNVLLLTLILSISFTACNRPDKKLPSKDGKWNYSAVAAAAGLSNTETGTLTFTKDGKGTDTSGGSSDSFTWSYDKSGKKITLTYSGASKGTVYEVKEAKAKSEKWYYTETDGGVTYTLDVTLTR